jgi:hypothetical protein
MKWCHSTCDTTSHSIWNPVTPAHTILDCHEKLLGYFQKILNLVTQIRVQVRISNVSYDFHSESHFRLIDHGSMDLLIIIDHFGSEGIGRIACRLGEHEDTA